MRFFPLPLISYGKEERERFVCKKSYMRRVHVRLLNFEETVSLSCNIRNVNTYR